MIELSTKEAGKRKGTLTVKINKENRIEIILKNKSGNK